MLRPVQGEPQVICRERHLGLKGLEAGGQQRVEALKGLPFRLHEGYLQGAQAAGKG
jgi:hypothetical protein